jgi:uncharacterized membrane protein YhiD involved in acid resistance
VGITIGEGMFGLGIFSTLLIIIVLVALRRVERAVIKRKRLFHYTLKTHDPADLLDRLLDLLAREHMQLEDLDVRDLSTGEHEVRLSIVTSLDGNRLLLRTLPHLGKNLRSSTHEPVD